LYRQTDRQTGRPTDGRQADRQTNRHGLIDRWEDKEIRRDARTNKQRRRDARTNKQRE
jgi:hypothetical protein